MGNFTNRRNSLKTIFLANQITDVPTEAEYSALMPGYTKMQIRRTFGSFKRACLLAFMSTQAANSAPTVANALIDQTPIQASELSYTFASNSFADANGDPLTYTAALTGGGALPGWLTFTAGTRTFAGTVPAYVGDATDITDVTVTATDIYGATITDAFTITVQSL